MADYIFTQNGDGNVQIGDMTGMPYHVNAAFKWALEHNYQSVAAQYARTLALEVERLRDENDRLYAALKLSQARARDYEDTGMTPDEIAALRAENAAYKADIDVGRLIRIPCREFFDGAGGTVWLLWGGEAIEMVHCGADIDAEGKLFAALVCEDKIFPYRDGDAGHDTEMSDWCTNTKYVSADEYAQTVFATEEAARAALGEDGQG